jgi:hypothetical protein
VNPNVEGDVWLADSNTVYRSIDSGANWTKLNNFASIWGNQQTTQWPDLQDASAVALGKPASGAPYSAAVYVVGVINGQSGAWQSDNEGASSTRSTTMPTCSAASARWRRTRAFTAGSTSPVPPAVCCTPTKVD